MKNLKISEDAHTHLKIFAARVNYNMGVIASEAVIKYVKEETKKYPPRKKAAHKK